MIRDELQRVGGHRAVAWGLLCGAVATAYCAPSMLVASLGAFLVSESLDWWVLTQSGNRMTSNVVGSVADTTVFLWLSPVPWVTWPLMVLSKLIPSILLLLREPLTL
jgi:uncharacterized PurR-regulated membrane protein YhhQ (DUF165 family)